MRVTPFPRDPAPDATLALLRRGYRFIPERCRRLGADAFETRLMLARAVCCSGEDAARMFYHPDRFGRVDLVESRTGGSTGTAPEDSTGCTLGAVPTMAP